MSINMSSMLCKRQHQELEDKPQTWKKHLQRISLTKGSYPEHTKNSKDSTIRKQLS